MVWGWIAFNTITSKAKTKKRHKAKISCCYSECHSLLLSFFHISYAMCLYLRIAKLNVMLVKVISCIVDLRLKMNVICIARTEWLGNRSASGIDNSFKLRAHRAKIGNWRIAFQEISCTSLGELFARILKRSYKIDYNYLTITWLQFPLHASHRVFNFPSKFKLEKQSRVLCSLNNHPLMSSWSQSPTHELSNLVGLFICIYTTW